MAIPAQQAQNKEIISVMAPIASKYYYSNETDVARVIQTNFPEFKVKVTPLAARRIQHEYRAHLAKRHTAATVLQKHVRSYEPRTGFAFIYGLIKEHVQNQKAAAVVIQKAFRKHTEASKVEKPTVESEFKRVWSFIPKADDSIITIAELNAFSDDLVSRVLKEIPSIILEFLPIQTIQNIIQTQLDNQWVLSGSEDGMRKEDVLFTAKVISQTDQHQEVLDLLSQFQTSDDIVLKARALVDEHITPCANLLRRLPSSLLECNKDEILSDIGDFFSEL